MIWLKKLTELEVSNLIKKGGLLIYCYHWDRYQEADWSDRFLVLKTRKQNHSINRTVATLNLRNGYKSQKETTLLWRNGEHWAYIPVKGNK